MRNYGDIGGLKTVQFRSLGAGHTAVVYDQLGLSNALSGQIDFGSIPATFTENIELVYAGGTSLALPVSSKMAGTALLISSKHQFFSTENKNYLGIGLLGGNFGLLEPSIIAQRQNEKLALVASFRLRTFNGTYPFSYQNGSTTVNEKRQNAQLLDYSGTLSAQFKLGEKHKIQLYGLSNYSDKGLPGSIVFYSNSNKQYLEINTFLAALRHSFTGKKWSSFSQVNFQNEQLRYLDSNYLNALGYLKSNFYAKTASAESQWKRKFSIKTLETTFLLGSSSIVEQLESENLSGSPLRINQQNIVALSVKKWGDWNIQLINQNVLVENATSTQFFPSFDWTNKWKDKWILGATARFTQRLPSFSELYYQQIGNEDLKPEKARLVSLRAGMILKNKQIFSQTLLQGFYTEVNDKILAVPTKNLFVWSIRNIAKTQSVGVEVSQNLRFQFSKSALLLNAAYTYAYSVDISDKSSELYKSLLSYSPLHSYSLELSYETKRLNIFVANNYQGWRYSLAENSYANFLPGFHVFNAGAGYCFDLKKSNLRLQVTANNLFNMNYQFIRYFPLMGRCFQAKLIFELQNNKT